MAIDRDDEDNNEENDQLVIALEKKLKITRWFLFATAGLSFITIAIMVTVVIVINGRLTKLQAPLPEALDAKFAELDQQINDVSNYRRIELRRIDVYSQKLEALRQECSVEKTTPLIALLVEREQDFQSMAKLMLSGATNLAGMVRGSRDWVEQHRKSVEALIESSEQREAAIKAQ